MTEAEYASEVITKDTPYLPLTGELWGVFCEDLGENWPRYNVAAVYVECDHPIHLVALMAAIL